MKKSLLFLSFLCLFGLANAQVFWTEDFGSDTKFQQWTSRCTPDTVITPANTVDSLKWYRSTAVAEPTYGAEYAPPAFTATTASNGFVVFDSDRYFDRTNHDARIISPSISCLGKNNVFLGFQAQYGFFTTDTTTNRIEAGVSTDGGVTWKWRRILKSVAQTSAVPNNNEFLRLPEAINQANVRIAFRWTGSWEYMLKLDDIFLTSTSPLPGTDLIAEFPRGPVNWSTPTCAIDSIGGVVRIRNKGSEPQTNFRVSFSVHRGSPTGANSQLFVTRELITTILQPDSTIQIEFDTAFLPPVASGAYFVRYNVTPATPDALNSDNTVNRTFRHSSILMAKDDGVIPTGLRPGTATGNFFMGNSYIFPKIGCRRLDSITFGVSVNAGTILAGRKINIYVFQIPANFTGNIDRLEDLSAAGGLIAANDFTFTTNTSQTVKVAAIDINTSSIGVNLDTLQYLIGAEFSPDMFCQISRLRYDYDVTTVVETNFGPSGQLFFGGFGRDATALVRLHVKNFNVNTEDPLADSEVISIAPNPTSENVALKFDLSRSLNDVTISVMNTSGVQITKVIRDQVSTGENVVLNTSTWANGLYLIQVKSAEGTRVEKLIVQH
jgi:hypothetical protein